MKKCPFKEIRCEDCQFGHWKLHGHGSEYECVIEEALREIRDFLRDIRHKEVKVTIK